MRNSKGASATVLVAEDDQAMRELVTDILDSRGYVVIAVGDGEAAFEIYSQKKDEIDLVILDMRMPGLDGRETFRKLKAYDKDVRVLLSSGYNQDGTSEELLSEGLAGFLGKPYRVAELLEKVEQAIETA